MQHNIDTACLLFHKIHILMIKYIFQLPNMPYILLNYLEVESIQSYFFFSRIILIPKVCSAIDNFPVGIITC